VALVTAFVLRDGATDCRPQPLAAAPVAAVQPLAVPPVAAPPRAVAAPPIETSWSSGVITFYGDASPGGACLASSVPANRYTAAAGPEQYANGAACGSYVDIKGRKGTIRVKITNLCPECPPGHLDLSNEAFAALDDMSKGRVSMSYRAVRNPSVGPLTVQLKDGSNPWWLAVRVDNHGNPLRSVEIASGSQGFEPMQLQGYGYWLDGNGAGDGPFRVRVTDVLGHRVTVSGIRLRPGAVQSTGVRLYGPGAGAAPRTTSSKPSAKPTTKAAAAPTKAATAKATATATTTTGTATAAPPTASPSVPLPTAEDAPTAGAALTTAPDRC
jgi:expansin (peptidoglycan-binding protein)